MSKSKNSKARNPKIRDSKTRDSKARGGFQYSRGSGSVVELQNLVRNYGAGLGLTDFSLHARPGELIALLGPSGCGKTTALRALAGLERLDSGTIVIDGENINEQPTSQRDIGVVFQSYSLFPHLTAGQNVEFGLRMRKVPSAERRTRATAVLDLVGLNHHFDRFAHQLSGGQQQRVALARALVTQPRVLLLDEPLSALDAKVRVKLREEIRRIQSELGITTFFVTHDQEEALAVADRVAVMREGRVEQIGTPEELYREPNSSFIANFIGLSNVLNGEVKGGKAQLLGVELSLISPIEDGPAKLYLRPENLAFVESGLPAIVLRTSFLGALRRTRVRLTNGVELVVQHSAREVNTIGEQLHIGLNNEPIMASRKDSE